MKFGEIPVSITCLRTPFDWAEAVSGMCRRDIRVRAAAPRAVGPGTVT